MAEVLGRYSNDKAAQGRMGRAVEGLSLNPSNEARPSKSRWKRHALRKRLSPEEKATLVQRYIEGEASPVLAKAFGLSENGVLAQLRRSGVKLRPLGKVTPADVHEMRRLRARGLTYQAIGDRYGITRVSVSKRLAKA